MKSLIMALVFCVSANAVKFDEAQVTDYGSQVESGGLTWLAPKVDETIAAIITRSVNSLTDQGYGSQADALWDEYLAHYDGFVTANFTTRHQGDHKAFLAFLTKVWDVVFEKVCQGDWAIAKALHISDLYSLNYAIVPVFTPCKFDLNGMNVDREAEYRRHFAKDDDDRALYGLLPIVIYWTVEGFCLGGTSGMGSLLCGVAASLAERFMGNHVAPSLSDKLYVRACGG